MSPENPNPNPNPNPKKETTTAAMKDETRKTRPPDPQHLNCPRCDSSNTKFCYYNNYSLTQPRHFCKTCRRYWTKGGALRNVPIGGGCRKTKKIKSGSSSISRSVEFFHGGGSSLSNSPAMDFQLGGSSSSSLIIPRVVHQYPNNNTSGIYTQFSSFGDTSASAAANTAIIDPLVGSCFNMGGFNFPLKQQGGGDIGGGGGGGGVIQGMSIDSNLASSIESLSCINQDLHWKLQQQRLSMLFGGPGGGGGDDRDKDNNFVENHQKLLQPILFQNLEISRKDDSIGGAIGSGGGGGGDTATEWFFDNSYAPGNSTATPVNNVIGGGANHQDNDVAASNHWNNNGIQAWNDLHQYTSNLP